MFSKLFFVGAIFLMTQFYAHDIVTVNGPHGECLHTQTQAIGTDELPLALEIAAQLKASLEPYAPAAGLAAPQIGISRSVFIYSFDRQFANLETVINPSFVPVSAEVEMGWEACFSVILGDLWKVAYLPRYDEIDVTYVNGQGERIAKRLEGFSAKVFQHEFDHLQGVACIHHPKATVKEFSTREEMMRFLQRVKEEDATRYNK